MIILSTADVHSPENLKLFMESIEKVDATPDIVLFAGDMVDKNKVFMYKPIIDAIQRKYCGPKMIAVFGNEEYRGYEKLYMQVYKEITWLHDSYISLNNNELCIIGTRGALDKPTTWQSRNIPGIEKYYNALPYKIEQMAIELRNNGCRKIILLTHYGVTYKNLTGEKLESYPYLACSKFEKIIRREIIDLVIHGHVHLGIMELVYLRDTPVFNVSLP
ncbi:MAG: metallophosphoesterase, partial [Desulfurococcaceae archaeon]